MRLIVRMIVIATLAATSLRAADPPPTSPDERARIATRIHALETTPLTDAAKRARTDLFAWLTAAPDISVNWCSGMIVDAPKKDKDLAGGMLIQAILSAAAFVLENPEKDKDNLLIARAGLHGALLAYRATVAADAKKSSTFFAKLAAQEDAGALDEYLKPTLAGCK
jgi:hypothetical protein